ncbi:copper-binding protein [Photobacterium frigidiphilum]|uniref:cupredoxin family protein n=1 Tax=Photobacterium frigidiphilum TaxID=264736 RepID=UPI003D148DF7
MKVFTLLALTLALSSTTTFAAGDHAGMNHDSMDMKNMADMDHSKMNHGDMDHGKMEHGAMMSAVGMPAPAEQATQTIQVSLSDDMKLKFEPSLNLKQGDIVRFVIINNGQIPHEFSIGSIDEQKKHRNMMRSMPNMEHSDGSTISLKSGEKGEITWHFMGQPFVEVACNIPGHAEAGMKMNFVLAAK